VALVWKGVESLPQYSASLREHVEKGISGKLRGEIWKGLSRSSRHVLSSRSTVRYEDLLKEDTEYAIQIRKDLRRTFPENILIQDVRMQQRLYDVLSAYCVHVREVGYCQGMAAIVGLLCIHMEDEDAFWTLTQLAKVYKLGSIWRPGLPGLLNSFYVLENLQRKFVPKLHKHLKKKRVITSMYATTWFVTVFLYNFSFVDAMRIWDLFFLEGFSFLYSVGLAFLKLNQDKVLGMDFEETVRFLQFNPRTPLDFEALLSEANAMKDVVKGAVRKYEARYKRCHQSPSSGITSSPKMHKV